MERCPYCQGEVDPVTRTCRWCGRVPFEDVSPTMPAPQPRPPRYCTACGDALPEGALFCGRCGKPVIPASLTTQDTLFDGRTLPNNAPVPIPAPLPQSGRGPAATGPQQPPLTPPFEPAPQAQAVSGLRPPAGTGPMHRYQQAEEEPKGMSSRTLLSLLLVALAIVTLVSAYLITQARSNQPSGTPNTPPVVNPTATPTSPPAPTDTPQPTTQPTETPTTGPAPTDTPAPTTSPAPTDTPAPAGSPTPGTSPTPATSPSTSPSPAGSPTPGTSPAPSPTPGTSPSTSPAPTNSPSPA